MPLPSKKNENKNIVSMLWLLTWVCVGDFIDFVRIQPNLLFTTSHNRGCKPLLELERTARRRKQRKTLVSEIEHTAYEREAIDVCWGYVFALCNFLLFFFQFKCVRSKYFKWKIRRLISLNWITMMPTIENRFDAEIISFAFLHKLWNRCDLSHMVRHIQ